MPPSQVILIDFNRLRLFFNFRIFIIDFHPFYRYTNFNKIFQGGAVMKSLGEEFKERKNELGITTEQVPSTRF